MPSQAAPQPDPNSGDRRVNYFLRGLRADASRDNFSRDIGGIREEWLDLSDQKRTAILEQFVTLAAELQAQNKYNLIEQLASIMTSRGFGHAGCESVLSALILSPDPQLYRAAVLGILNGVMAGNVDSLTWKQFKFTPLAKIALNVARKEILKQCPEDGDGILDKELFVKACAALWELVDLAELPEARIVLLEIRKNYKVMVGIVEACRERKVPRLRFLLPVEMREMFGLRVFHDFENPMEAFANAAMKSAATLSIGTLFDLGDAALARSVLNDRDVVLAPRDYIGSLFRSGVKVVGIGAEFLPPSAIDKLSSDLLWLIQSEGVKCIGLPFPPGTENQVLEWARAPFNHERFSYEFACSANCTVQDRSEKEVDVLRALWRMLRELKPDSLHFYGRPSVNESELSAQDRAALIMTALESRGGKIIVIGAANDFCKVNPGTLGEPPRYFSTGTLLSDRLKQAYKAIIHLSSECMAYESMNVDNHPYAQIFDGTSLPVSVALDSSHEPFGRIPHHYEYPDVKISNAWDGIIFRIDGDEDSSWFDEPSPNPATHAPAGPRKNVLV